MNSQEVPAFKDLAKLVRGLKIALCAFGCASLMIGYSSWLQIQMLQSVAGGGPITEEAATANDVREFAVDLLHVVVFLVTAFLFLRWTYLTKRNAAALGAQALEFSPRWSVGSYFVPIVTLWKPYQALRESFQASHPEFRDNWLSAPYPRLLAVWWTLWLINSIAGHVLLRVSLDAKTPAELLNASWATLWFSLPTIALVPVVWMLVSTLQRWQTGKFHALQQAPS